MAAYVYMIRCANGSLYTGWTTDLKRRLAQHQAGTGAKFTRGFKAVEMVYLEEVSSREDALKREYVLKHLKKARKEELVRCFTGKLQKIT